MMQLKNCIGKIIVLTIYVFFCSNTNSFFSTEQGEAYSATCNFTSLTAAFEAVQGGVFWKSVICWE